MRDDRGTLRDVRWRDIYSWLALIGQSFRLAIAPRILLLAALGLVATIAGWRVIGYLYTQADSSFAETHDADPPWPWEYQPADRLTGDAAALPATVGPIQLLSDTLAGRRADPFLDAWEKLSRTFRHMFEDDRPLSGFTYLLLCSLWTLAIWSFFGGAITRIAALSLTREDHLGMMGGLRYARSKWADYFMGPMFPLIGAFLATLPIALFGLLLRADVGVLIAGFLWPVVIAAGFVLAILLVVLVFGWPLMWGTISTEGTDSFDALSRSYAYVYQRPLQYFLYVIAAAIVGILGYVVVWLFTHATVELGWWAVSWGSGLNEMHDVQQEIVRRAKSDSFGIGVQVIRFWIGCVWTLAIAYSFSFFWSASTAIYLLLRWHVDQTELDEIALGEDDTMFGLPPLKADPAGVPSVVDVPPVGPESGAPRPGEQGPL